MGATESMFTDAVPAFENTFHTPAMSKTTTTVAVGIGGQLAFQRLTLLPEEKMLVAVSWTTVPTSSKTGHTNTHTHRVWWVVVRRMEGGFFPQKAKRTWNVWWAGRGQSRALPRNSRNLSIGMADNCFGPARFCLLSSEQYRNYSEATLLSS